MFSWPAKDKSQRRIRRKWKNKGIYGKTTGSLSKMFSYKHGPWISFFANRDWGLLVAFFFSDLFSSSLIRVGFFSSALIGKSKILLINLRDSYFEWKPEITSNKTKSRPVPYLSDFFRAKLTARLWTLDVWKRTARFSTEEGEGSRGSGKLRPGSTSQPRGCPWPGKKRPPAAQPADWAWCKTRWEPEKEPPDK